MVSLRSFSKSVIFICFCIICTGLVFQGKDGLLTSSANAGQDSIQFRDVTVEEAFNRLAEDRFVHNGDRMRSGVGEAFGHRNNEAIEYSLAQMRKPNNTFKGESVTAEYRFDVARNVLLTYKTGALPRILNEYTHGDSLTKGNIIQVVGKIKDEDKLVRKLLVNALDDNSVSEAAEIDSSERPLRVCDFAYNEIVLRYGLRDIPRSLGSIHRIEDRDYCIAVLKSLLDTSGQK